MTQELQNEEKYPNPTVAVDLALLTVLEGDLHCLIVKRSDEIDAGGDWGLPGGFVHIDVSLEDTVLRVLNEKAHLNDAYLEQLGTFGSVDRDVRGRVISIAYFALTPAATLLEAIKDNPRLDLAQVHVPWLNEKGGAVKLKHSSFGELPLAFDHALIIGDVVKRLRGKLDYTTVGLELLGKTFTLRELQEIHEAILGRKLTKPPFRRKMIDKGLIQSTGRREKSTAFRPAELYKRKTKKRN